MTYLETEQKENIGQFYIDTKYGEDIRVYIDKQTLKIDDFYTQEKLQEREESRREEYKEVMET